jgi:putative photosynthetic complex assembly protein
MQTVTAQRTSRSSVQVPRYLAVAAVTLLGFSLLMAAVSKQTGIGRTPDTSAQTQMRMLSFERQDDNSMLVVDAVSGETLDRFASADEGFIPGALRGLQYERRRHGKPVMAPYKLIAAPGRGIALIDPSTGLYVQLEAFGSGNAKDVSRYLPTTRVSTL